MGLARPGPSSSAARFLLAARAAMAQLRATSSAATAFDYLVLGGGSGGLASARRAAELGARAAVVEKGRLGGTCVNVGCVPKKVMWNTAVHSEFIHDHMDYGFEVGSVKFSWRQPSVWKDDGMSNSFHRPQKDRRLSRP